MLTALDEMPGSKPSDQSLSGRDPRGLVANRRCIIMTARSRQTSPDLVNQIDGAAVWAPWCT